MRCVICGPVEVASIDEHMTSSEHRNAVEIDYDLRAKVYIPSVNPDESLR